MNLSTSLKALLVSALGCWLSAQSAFGADSRADFLKLIDRPRVALAPQAQESPASNGLVQLQFSFAADARQRVPGILVKTTNAAGPRPVVIVMHGTGGRKEDELPLLRKLAGKGFIGVAIDGRYHGQRAKAGHGTEEYEAAIVRAWHQPGEHPLYYDTVWDVMRLVDYLQTRQDVDPKRIGLSGISKGGIETYFAAAADPRIAAAVPFIGVQSFRWALETTNWQGRIATIQHAFDAIAKASGVAAPDSAFVQKFYDRMVPGIYSEFDGPRMLALITPRPLLMVNGDSDRNTPLPGVEECIAAARQAYRDQQAESHFKAIIQKNCGHKVEADSEAAAIAWFVQWLKP